MNQDIFSRVMRTSWLSLHQSMQVRNHQLQSIDFVILAAQKNMRQKALREAFRNKTEFCVYITDAHLKKLHLVQKGAIEEKRLPLRSVLENGSILRLPELDGNIVVVNNSDIDSDNRMANFSIFYELHPSTIFIGWDSDNHHTLQVSMAMASLVDFYVQAHPENFYDLSRFNSLRAYVPLGVFFITMADSIKLLPRVLKSKRSDEPRGYFSQHGVFEWRNRVIATLSNSYESVGFQFNGEFLHTDKMTEYFENMTQNKAHWVVPALNDVSGRIFEIFLAGGIPLLPESLRFHPGLEGMDGNHVVYYSLNDVVDPRNVLEEAINKFNHGGANGIRSRFDYAISNHADRRLEKILSMAASYFEFVYN